MDIEIVEDTTEDGEQAPAISVFYGGEGAFWISQLQDEPFRANMVGMSREQARKVRDALSTLIGE